MQTPEELLSRIKAEEKKDLEERAGFPAIGKISIDITGTRGRRYVGEFVYKVPTLADQITIGRLKTSYLPEGGAADANAAILVEQISYLAVTIQDPKPEWWQPFAMYDAAPIGALYGEALTYERKFHGEIADSEGVASGNAATRSEQDPGSDTDGEAHVGRKVQAPAQRRETIVSHAEGRG